MKVTPEPDSRLRLPKTMRCTTTAVPHSSETPRYWRYTRAGAESHDSSTLRMQATTCPKGSSTNTTPWSRARDLYAKAISRICSAVKSSFCPTP